MCKKVMTTKFIKTLISTEALEHKGLEITVNKRLLILLCRKKWTSYRSLIGIIAGPNYITHSFTYPLTHN